MTPLPPELAALEAALCEALSLFSSAIKSGENWSTECQTARTKADIALSTLCALARQGSEDRAKVAAFVAHLDDVESWRGEFGIHHGATCEWKTDERAECTCGAYQLRVLLVQGYHLYRAARSTP